MWSYLNPLPGLPKYKGPYKVGSSEYEILVSEIPSSTRVPDSSIETVKFRVFYPTSDSATSKTSIPWLPTPQKEWNKAYARFLGSSGRSGNVIANFLSLLNYATIPAVQNAPLLPNHESKQWPVVVFSHGLGGNYNTYSAFAGSLASCGMIVITPEHRDQSAPISFIKTSSDEPARSVLYKIYSHNPTVDVLNARNAMLRIRMWELEKVFTAVTAMNNGEKFSNLADTVSDNMPEFANFLDLRPGRITWAGHSFGSVTMVQFVKSVYYHQTAPTESDMNDDHEGWDWTPLYTPSANSELVKQITPESPMALLDLWTMPLASKSTEWLWKQPLPCYHRENTDTSKPSVISIMSTEFFKWSRMVNRTKALLSADPIEVFKNLEESSEDNKKSTSESSERKEPSPELSLDITPEVDPTNPSSEESNHETLLPPSPNSTRTPSPARSSTSATSEASTQSSLHSSSIIPNPPSKTTSTSPFQPQLYYIPQSSHMSQSDFGVLTPNLTKYLLKIGDPYETMDLNVRAVLAMIRGCGIEVGTLSTDQNIADNILNDDAIVSKRWVRLPLDTKL